MNINPKVVVERGFVQGVEFTDADHPECQIQQNGVDLRITRDIKLQHGSFVNVEFIETIHCIDNVFAMPVCVRSSLSRKGIFMTSGVYDTGYSGPGGGSIYNMSGGTIRIEAGTRVCQIMFFRSPEDTEKYDGGYNHTDSIDPLDSWWLPSHRSI